jgi:pyroglutamyl-peptidase
VVARACVERVWQRAAVHGSEVIVALGQASGARAVRLEDRAYNINDFPIPDNAGNCPRCQWIEPGAPLAYQATWPRSRIGEALQRSGVPIEHSFSAGTYVCNHLLYGLLHRTARMGSPPRVGFIHLPLLPHQVPPGRELASLPLRVMVAGIRRALEVCAGPVDQEADSRMGPIQEVRDARMRAAARVGRPSAGAG